MNEILRALQEPLYRHILTIVGDPTIAEDVLQETLFIICRKLIWLHEPQWLRAWAYRIGTREAMRRAKRDRRWLDALLGDEELNRIADATIEDPETTDMDKLVPQILDNVSPASRIVMQMHYLDGLTLVEIAEALDVSLGTVKSRLAYGLSVLRKTRGWYGS
jgi:RNA polymerase sigma-70 factor (ECF subfamily)